MQKLCFGTTTEELNARKPDPMNQTLIPQRLVLKRGLMRNSTRQIGALYHKGKFFCHVLEDPSRDGPKIWGKTAIPAGVYDVVWNLTQGRAKRNRDRWRWHELGVFHIPNVPNFTLIQIHTGNFPEDTNGCPLLGGWNGRSGNIDESVKAYRKFYDTFLNHAKFNALQIEIIEG